jgi:Ca2+-binding RTX toxin-like protein
VELHGGDGPDRLTGSNSDYPDLLDGGGDDALSGLAGPDTLSGAAAASTR